MTGAYVADANAYAFALVACIAVGLYALVVTVLILKEQETRGGG